MSIIITNFATIYNHANLNDGKRRKGVTLAKTG